ncbi:hypothetical protein BGZ99_000682 [Dissophora globulifera]|uniref:Uncharacterized protein n=1 Tax=Dissophora globulifera TaxID=979702 RepID=A0A9P6UK43_9FUNG|nr:hypothetical protein BGZ99_000682 [Dissophora globulifera]
MPSAEFGVLSHFEHEVVMDKCTTTTTPPTTCQESILDLINLLPSKLATIRSAVNAFPAPLNVFIDSFVISLTAIASSISTAAVADAGRIASSLLQAINAILATLQDTSTGFSALLTTPAATTELTAVINALKAILAKAVTVVTCTGAQTNCVGLLTLAGDAILSITGPLQIPIPGLPVTFLLQALSNVASALRTNGATLATLKPLIDRLFLEIETVVALPQASNSVVTTLSIIETLLNGVITCLGGKTTTPPPVCQPGFQNLINLLPTELATITTALTAFPAPVNTLIGSLVSSLTTIAGTISAAAVTDAGRIASSIFQATNTILATLQDASTGLAALLTGAIPRAALATVITALRAILAAAQTVVTCTGAATNCVGLLALAGATIQSVTATGGPLQVALSGCTQLCLLGAAVLIKVFVYFNLVNLSNC